MFSKQSVYAPSFLHIYNVTSLSLSLSLSLSKDRMYHESLKFTMLRSTDVQNPYIKAVHVW